ncbi:hypothetical protein FQA39_LY10876 [Lamprigera yunnana]|nr:hypothetical protein FQA39_LY10876 [Lamprigera yunnana]
MSNDIDESKKLKLKRRSKTTEQQYEIYLREMENNVILRTGTVNPTLPENYMRVTDWKNSTRQKYRKLLEEKKRSRCGPLVDIKLLPLEDRGLAVWGKVTVAGTPKVVVTGGLQEIKEVPSEIPLYSNVLDLDIPTENIASMSSPPESTSQKPTLKRLKTSKKSIKEVGEELLDTYKKYVNDTKQKNELEERKIKLEEMRLQFEIAKYKRISLLENSKENVSKEDTIENETSKQYEEFISNIFPLQNEEDLVVVEVKLEEEPGFKVKLNQYCCRIGGHKTDEITKLMLRRLFSDKLASLYSWLGAKKKKVFCHLQLANVIINSVCTANKNTANCTEKDVVDSIKNWLRHASTRDKKNKVCV